jgi:hypothetical protein
MTVTVLPSRLKEQYYFIFVKVLAKNSARIFFYFLSIWIKFGVKDFRIILPVSFECSEIRTSLKGVNGILPHFMHFFVGFE